MTPLPVETLRSAALAVRTYAHAPYSKFQVGAAVLTASSEIFAGCNVENASYGLTNCAERTAIFSAVASGGKKLKLACVVVYTPTKTAPAPGGACRQVIYEFGPQARVISTCDGRQEVDVSIDALLPGAFGPADLA